MTPTSSSLTRHGESDVAVIGGGVVGMSLAYGLTRQGVSITVFDEGDDAFRASRGNFALVWVQGKGVDNPDYARWTARSADLWQGFAKDLTEQSGTTLFYSRRGGIIPCLSDEELEGRVNSLSRLHNAAPETPAFEVLDRARIKAMVPDLGPEVVGGTYNPADGHVNALRLLGALHKVCMERGVVYRPNQHAVKVEPVQDGFRIVTSEGEFRSRKIILAAGLGNKDLAPMVGMSAPIRAQRGEVMVTEKLAPFLDYPIGVIRQTNEGGVMIGVSMEEVGLDKGTDSQVLADIAGYAVRLIPRLGDVQIVRCWGALRVLSPDGYPIYEKSQTCPGAYLVTCHSGITLAAAHADTVAKAIAEDAWPDALQSFSARRFENVSASA